ncbi:MAG: hypothetical protein AMK69_02625 [Nitrospira bacterium SG8_3]|nr:MAG: hypothetical protein AMK69_02625 [Nitrospira bacterium SG8_3]
MKKCVGIWIDHEKAVLVFIVADKETTTSIESNVEGRVRLSGGSRSRTPYGPQDVASERKKEERHKHQLRRYYEKIIGALGDSKQILIFGPGEAKIELEKEMKRSKELGSRIVSVDPADKMTEKQIAAKVRDFFRLDREESVWR